MAKRKGNSRSRRVQREWTKGNRERLTRLDAAGRTVEELDDDVGSLRASMRPKGITIDEERDVTDLPKGEVVRARSGVYDVLITGSDERVACRLKRGASSENESATLVVVGDIVRVQQLEEGHGLVCHVEERRSEMARSGTGRKRGGIQSIVANLDVVFCVVSAERDDVRRTVIDRFIVGALLGSIEPIVVVNKIDTADKAYRAALADGLGIYPELGYEMLFTSATDNIGIDEIQAVLGERTGALVGQSGVGKSTLVNALLGRSERAVGEVRARDRRGRHTTVGSAIINLEGGGRIVDTPGLREFGIPDLEPQELDGYFVDFLDYISDCRYVPCTHTHEPDCAVQAAVEADEIDYGRFESYLSILGTLGEDAR